MHASPTGAARHDHVYLGQHHRRHERRTWLVVGLTAATMVAEIVGGTVFGSMALVADGWHMSTHAAALGIAALAYRFARTHAHDPRFTFGTGKLGELAAFASAVLLAVVALLIGYESATRLVAPVPIRFSEALPIAVLGLLVNLASAWLLRDDHGAHGHGGEPHGDRAAHAHPSHAHPSHAHAGHDTNLRAAYIHVLADVLTSVLAIAALLAGQVYAVAWLDPAMGLVGSAVILVWSWGLLRQAGAVLLDTVPDPRLAEAVRVRLGAGGEEVTDLHLWRLGPGHVGVVASLVSARPESPDAYKRRLSGLDLAHVTVEVNPAQGSPL